MTVTPQQSDPGQTTEIPPTDSNDTVSAINQPTDPPAPEPFDPENFAFPETLNREHDTFKDFLEYAKVEGVSKPQAEKLFSMHAAALKATEEAITKSWMDQQAAWVDEIKKDSEIGNLDEVRRVTGAIFDNPAFADPGVRKALDWTGAGNHPAVVRTLFKMAKALNEGSSVNGNPGDRNKDGDLTRPVPVSAGAAIYGPNGPHSGGPKMG